MYGFNDQLESHCNGTYINYRIYLLRYSYMHITNVKDISLIVYKCVHVFILCIKSKLSQRTKNISKRIP